MKKLMIAAFIVLTAYILGSALTSSADEYYYYDSHDHPVERHQHRDSGFDINFIRPSDPFNDDDVYYYDDGHGHYYYHERDFDDDNALEFKLDIL